MEGTVEARARVEAEKVGGEAQAGRLLLQRGAEETRMPVAQGTEGSKMTGPFLVPPADHAEQLAGELARELSKGQGAATVVVEAEAAMIASKLARPRVLPVARNLTMPQATLRLRCATCTTLKLSTPCYVGLILMHWTSPIGFKN